MKKVVIFALAFVLIFSLGVSAQEDYDLDIQLNQKLNYLNGSEQLSGLTELDMEITQNIAFDKKLYLNPVLKLSYDENYSFSDLEFNEKLNDSENYDYLKEAYFDLYLENADIRIGRQNMNWGSAYKINPTDVINPMDLSAEDPLDSKLGVSSLRSDYYFDFNTSLTGVITANHRPSPVPDKVENMVYGLSKNMIKGNIFNTVFQETNDKQKSEFISNEIMTNNFILNKAEARGIEDLRDFEMALKYTKRNFQGYDLSLSYFRGYEDILNLTSDYDKVENEIAKIIKEYQINNSSNRIANFNFGYKETQSIGASARGSIKDIGVWSELNYTQNEDDEKNLDLVLGGDYTFDNNFYTVVQLYHRNYKDYQINEILKDDFGTKLLDKQNFLILHGEIPFRSIHTIKGDIIADLEKNNYMLNPAVNFSLANNFNLNLGAVVSESEKNNEFSLMNFLGQEKVYFELSKSF